MTKEMYDFDYSSILKVERHQIQRVYNSLSYYSNTPSKYGYVDHKTDLFWMKISLYCLDVLNDDIELGIFEDEKDYKTDVINQILEHKPFKYKILKKVNTKNHKRFLNGDESIFENDVIKETLYKAKVWNLYNKIRYYHMKEWWD